LLAGRAVVVSIHYHARTVIEKKLGFLAGSHLRAVLPLVASEVDFRHCLETGRRLDCLLALSIVGVERESTQRQQGDHGGTDTGSAASPARLLTSC
jgi:hypothetical protein